MAGHHVLPLLKQNTKEQKSKQKRQKLKFLLKNGIVFVQELEVRARAVF
jgi:hypothetical protein